MAPPSMTLAIECPIPIIAALKPKGLSPWLAKALQ